MSTYALSGSIVLRDGAAELSYNDVAEFMKYAVLRRLRKRGHVGKFLSDLCRSGVAEYEWSFTRHWWSNTYHSVCVRAEQEVAGTYRIICTGLKAELAVARVCNALENEARPKPASKKKKRVSRRKVRHNAKHERLREKQRLRPERLEMRAASRFVPSPISRKRSERLVQGDATPRQFRKQHIPWEEAIRSTVAIFQVRGTVSRTPLQVVESEFLNSLDQSGNRFVRFRRDGFTLRFDLIDGRWRGDITPLTVSATKDNRHPTYRRMRRYFRERLGFLTDSERAERRARYEAALALPSNVVILGGVRYSA